MEVNEIDTEKDEDRKGERETAMRESISQDLSSSPSHSSSSTFSVSDFPFLAGRNGDSETKEEVSFFSFLHPI